MEATAFSEIVSALAVRDVKTCTAAAARLHAEATVDDVQRLVSLLESDDFFVREAAAWPLAELSGPAVLGELFVAYQRGVDEGHDNDGFTAALLEIPALYPNEARAALVEIVHSAIEPLRGHAEWLLEFCEASEGKQ